ncbi:MAG TPA: DUF885 family protein [Rhizomicrobium sp.]|nr:DUF885 family protein [Rhizomicrobium sp.]
MGAGAAALLPLRAFADPMSADIRFNDLLDDLKDASDLSPDAAAARRIADARLVRLRAFDTSGLSAAARLEYDGIVEGAACEAALCAANPFGLVGAGQSPYALSPRSGAYLGAPSVIKNGPPQALAILANTIAAQTRHLAEAGAAGFLPPDFILDATLAKVSASRDASPAALTAALDAQIAALTALRVRATPDTGVWRQPNGDTYYVAALAYGTTLAIAPEAAHAQGLEQVRALSARAEPLLRAQGLTKGSVGARLHALAQDPRTLYSDDDTGRAKAVADMNTQLARVRPLLGTAFRELSSGPIDVELAGPGLIGYRKAPSYDGKFPGAYYVDLRNIARRPDWSLPTVVHHETLPGHLLQLPLQERAAPPPLRLRYNSNAYFEGWAIYAEQLADEMGLFDGDDRPRLGFLQSLLVRAGRLVVDTGIHFKRWSRAEAIARFFDIAGDAPDTFENEVDRIVVQPGLTSGPALGAATILRLRETAKARAEFNLTDFHAAILNRGAMRLSLLDRALSL